MKTGRSLVELATELQRQVDTKHDYVADTRHLELTRSAVTKEFSMAVNGHGNFEPTSLFHDQLAQRLGIPAKYYNRMAAEGESTLLVDNVNHWLKNAKKPEKRMVRTMDGQARAFLSDRYRPLDNFELAESVLPKLTQSGCEVISAELTDTRFYIKAITERISGSVSVGDAVQGGLVISNSEVGLGAVRIEPLVFRLNCTNGMISVDAGIRKYHVGRSGDEFGLDQASEFYRSETRLADDKAFWLKVQDVVDASLDKVKFERIVERFRQAQGEAISASPVAAVEVVNEKFELRNGEKDSVLNHLIKGGDLSRYGMVNAITRASQDVESYDRATDLERLGGQVLVLAKREWDEIATDWSKSQR